MILNPETRDTGLGREADAKGGNVDLSLTDSLGHPQNGWTRSASRSSSR